MHNLEDRLRKRVSRIELDAQRNARVVERKINDFARKRQNAISQLQAVETLLNQDAGCTDAVGSGESRRNGPGVG
ncbi:MAG: hypothetical protein R3E58_01455 [Phycisphaerae bacterium]